MTPSRRLVASALAAICALPVVALHAQRSSDELKSLARDRLAQLSGTIAVPGLDSAVEVRRDRWGVPHIYARTTHDLFFAQGFVAAQDRLFQMEMWRRIGVGRLAEVLGPTFVPRDRFARLLKYRGDMDAEWSSYAPDAQAIVTAFVEGVNAYVDRVRDRPPVEFTLLGFLPERWTPDVPLQRMAALTMTGNAEYEVMRAQLVASLGAERAELLMPTIPYRKLDPVPGLSLDGISSASLGAYDAATGPVRYPRVVGSNNWVISGALSATGKPILANDPHRYLDTPALRYLTHLVGPGWNVIGAGEPGVPGVAAGHNERVGFGFTIVGMDQQDLYVERVRACGRGRCVFHRGEWRPTRIVVDTIPVKGERARVDTLHFTAHGPLVSEDSLRDAGGEWRGFALRFVGAEPGTAGYLAQLSVNRASDWRSFLAAAERWKLPTENLMYADVDGNIGWVAAGLMPKRDWSGLLPVPGSGDHEWRGFRRFEELPRSYNPASRFIVTANHDIRPAGYATPLNFEFATPFRARRITEVLRDTSRHPFSVKDFERLQHDETSMQARLLVPDLLAAANRGGQVNRWAYTVLAGWDHVMRADAVAPLLYEAWRRSLSGLAVQRVVPAYGGRTISAAGWLDEWDDPRAALARLASPTRDSLMLAAMDTALVVLSKRMGEDTTAWRWGTLHTASFAHRVAGAFDLPSVARGGNSSTLNSTSGADYRQQYGASFREILDLADWDRSVATSVPGQSGQPESEFYDNLLPLWSRGEYFPLVYSRAAVVRETRHLLWLEPVSPSKRH